MAHILVTGGSGFIGSHLVERLLEEGHLVTNFDLRPADGNPGARHLVGDVRDEGALRAALEGQDAVCHLAAMVGVVKCIRQEEDVISTNYRAVETLARLCGELGIRSLLFASSSEVYGEGSGAGLLREESKTAPLSVYGRTKRQSEELLADFSREKGVKVTILRYCNIFGPRQRVEFVIPIFLRQALGGQPLTLCADGSQVRSYTYVKDAVEGTVAALNREGSGCRTYNICSSNTVTVLELAKTVIRLTGGENPIRFQPYEQLGRVEGIEVLCRIPSGEKAERELGFRAATGLETGLEETIAYHRAERERA